MSTSIKNKIIGGFFSSTMWFGFVVMITQWLNNNTTFIASYFPAEYADLVGYGVGALIWFFRWITSESVQDKTPAAKAEQARVDAEIEANKTIVEKHKDLLTEL